MARPASSTSAKTSGRLGEHSILTSRSFNRILSFSSAVSIKLATGCGSLCKRRSPASIRAIQIVSLTRESNRSASSSMIVTSSFWAGDSSSSMEDAAALIEVRGVLNSCARASRSMDFISSFCRAASIRLAVSSARARSIAIAVRLPMACNAVSDMAPPLIARLPTGSPPRLSGKRARRAAES